MQTLLFAAALSALSPGLSTTTTSYFNAAKLAQASGSPLLVIIEDPSSTSHRPIDLNALRSNNRPLEAQVCRIDANTQFGAKLAESYGVQSLPYAVITNGEGDIIYRGAAPLLTATMRAKPQPAFLQRSALKISPAKSHSRKCNCPMRLTALNQVSACWWSLSRPMRVTTAPR